MTITHGSRSRVIKNILIGEAGLHPKLKRPIGQRLAKLAQGKVYGKDVE
jgi:hypothetical protein